MPITEDQVVQWISNYYGMTHSSILEGILKRYLSHRNFDGYDLSKYDRANVYNLIKTNIGTYDQFMIDLTDFIIAKLDKSSVTFK